MPLKIQHDETPALNLTSMIDMLFLLIIFFMVATKFDELERNIEVAVPQVAQADDERLAAEAAGGERRFGRRHRAGWLAVTLEELTARLAAARTPSGEPSVVIRGDAEVCVPEHRVGTGRLPSGRHFGTGHHRPHRRAGQAARPLTAQRRPNGPPPWRTSACIVACWNAWPPCRWPTCWCGARWLR